MFMICIDGDAQMDVMSSEMRGVMGKMIAD